MLLDVIFLVILALCVIVGRKRGIIKTLVGLSSTFLSIIAALLLYKPFMLLINTSPAISAVIKGIKNSIKTAVMPTVKLENAAESLPDVFKSMVGQQAIANGKEAICSAIANSVMNIIIMVIFFILIRVLIGVILKFTKVTAKLPVIKQANGVLGGVLGFFTGILICWITAAVLGVFAGTSGNFIVKSVETSLFAKYLFKSNILFMFLR